MKKPILLLATTIAFVGLSAFGYMNWHEVHPSIETTIDKIEDEDFFYGLGPRFSPVTKKELSDIQSIFDFLDITQAPRMASISSVSIIIVKKDRPTNIRETGPSHNLTDSQLNLLQSSDISTHFSVRAEGENPNSTSGEMEYSKFNPYLTIVPEKQAKYIDGETALLDYIRTTNKKHLEHLEADKLRPAMLYFTVNADGTLSDLQLDHSSGYVPMDRTMIDLLSNTPGKWQPAENANGEKVAQQLVITFAMDGC